MSGVITSLEMVRSADTFDVTDYPACSVFVPVSETSGSTLTELVQGGSVDLSKDATAGAANARTITWSGNGVSLGTLAGGSANGYYTGSAISLDYTKNIVAVISCDTGGAGTAVYVGDAGNPGISWVDGVGAAFVKITDDSANADTVADGDTAPGTWVPTAAATKAVAFWMDLAAGKKDIHWGELTASTFTDQEQMTTMTIADNITPITPLCISPSTVGAVTVYGVAVFEFTTLPLDVGNAVAWMNYHWRNGNKVLYPPWKGLS